jgi:putative aldouronate transport system permease protein
MSTHTAKRILTSKKSHLHRMTIGDVVILFIVSLLGFSMLYPFYNLILQSFCPNWVITEANGVLFWPKDVTLENYKYVLIYPNVWNSYNNTIFVTVVGTALSLVMTTLGGYALSKRDLPFRMPMTLLILITMWFNGGLIPQYLNLRRLGFLNTLWVMIIPDTISTSNLLLMRNFFLGMPNDLKESAYIDGATEPVVLLKIVLPLSMPIMATMALFYGVSNWNEYTTPLLYNTKDDLHTIQVILQRMYRESVQRIQSMDDVYSSSSSIATEAVRSATVVFATLPIVMVYPYLQKYFAKGVMVGSLKG